MLILYSGFFIFVTWWWSRYYYILLPCITITVALNCTMIASLLLFKAKHTIIPEKQIIPETPETLILLIPCYNETKEELLRSLDSLVSQVGIDKHPRCIMIICDGRVRGFGMEKTTADYLLYDILVDKTSRKYIRKAYQSWEGSEMDVTIQKGQYSGVPYFCIIKEQNQGKRDGLIVVRSFLYNFNIREQRPQVIFSPRFFQEMGTYLIKDSEITNVTHLVGLDADTVFEESCVAELLKESRYVFVTATFCLSVVLKYNQIH